jgi:ferritin-like metal-binding protein YciE
MTTWNDVLIEAVNLLFKIVTVVAIPYLSYMVSKSIKNDNLKHLVNRGEEFVKKSVAMVQQTFVDSLKKEGRFDKDAQQEAFRMAYETWMEMASEEVKDAILEQTGNIDTWLNTMIEAQIHTDK